MPTNVEYYLDQARDNELRAHLDKTELPTRPCEECDNEGYYKEDGKRCLHLCEDGLIIIDNL